MELIVVSIVGFVGLLFLVLGFKKGTVLQFSVYSLLLTFVLGFVGEQTNTVSVVQKLPELLIVTLGYLAFVWGQFSKVKSKPSVLGHIYFILAHVCFGGLLFLQWHLLDSVSKIAIAFFQELLVFVLASCIWMFIPVKHKEQKRIVWWQYALFALPISLAVLLGLDGLKSTHPFYSALIGLLTPTITVIIATILGIEKLKWKPMVGLMLIIFGLLMFYF
ncbi:EamA family transporter [Winogradskyella poriferorum]|uniref:EamA family transporter n=1 Tax=Winogradskyella poriferorum TaxID=307627 RepID=UPI003D649D10